MNDRAPRRAARADSLTTPSPTATTTPLACPTGNPAPTGGDVPLVMLFGIVGAVIGGTASLTQSTAPTVPAYTLRGARTVLKIGVGALSAIVGLVFLRAGLVPGFQLTSPGQILAYAVAFGAAQQLLTRIVDQTAERVTETAATGTDGEQKAGSSTATGQPA